MTDLLDMPNRPIPETDDVPWTRVARAAAVPFDRGVAAMVDDDPVAIFRLSPVDADPDDDAGIWHAVSHIDPVGGAPVIARGLVGSTTTDEGVCPIVVSPMDKRRYNLETGRCIDGGSPELAIFEILVADGWVLVR